MARYRKIPVKIDAIRWEGGDFSCLDDFCGRNWSRADVVDEHMHDDEGVVVWNTKARQWLNVPVGHWLIRGIAGELYPCASDVFEATYEPVDTGGAE